jgi:6-phosphogluconolactonase
LLEANKLYKFLLFALLLLSCQPTLQVEAKPKPASAPASPVLSPKTQTTSSQSLPGSYWIYVGTYTDKIYQLKLDRETKTLTHVGSFGGVQKPSFIAVHPTQKYLYAVNEVASFGTWKSGAVSAFAIDAKTGALTHLNDQPSGGTGPCHLSVDPTGKFLFVANYQSGSVAVLPIKEDGSVEKPSSIVQHKGKGSNPKRQSQPHAHYIQAVNATYQREEAESNTAGPSGTLVFSADLGADRIFVYRFDASAGELTLHDAVKSSPGAGPRHLAMHTTGCVPKLTDEENAASGVVATPSDARLSKSPHCPTPRFVYVLNELRSNIVAYLYDASKGSLEEFQTISTIPKGAGANSTAEIVIHPSGKFLYNSNRGHNSISMYSLDESTGQLTLLGHESTQGKTPRNFNIDPSGDFLIAANQSSGTLVVFEIDDATGLLTDTKIRAEIPTPVCIKFVPAN